MPKKPMCQCGTCPACRMRRHRANNPETVRANDRARYERDKEKRRAAMDAYQQTPEGKAAHTAATSRWRQANPERALAHSRLNYAIRTGKLQRGPCEVGVDCEGKVHAHHDDYSKPLDVRWLCVKHHRVAHAAVG